MIFSALINNITLIISLSILYSFIIRRWTYGSRTGRIVSGVLFGAVAIIGMMNPLVFSPGLIFDGRSIIISAAGFLGGWVTALVAAVLAIVYRGWLGGPGAVMGVCVITSSAVIGIAYHYIRRYKPQAAGPLYLIGFGIVVHFFMLIMTMTLPSGMKFEILSKIALPVMTIYPLGTLLVCIVLLDLESRLRAEDALRKSEERYRSLVENADEAITVIQDGIIKFVNNRAVASFGYTEQEFLLISAFELVHPEDRNLVMERYFKKIAGDTKPTRHTYRAIHKSGKTVWIEISSVLIDWDGRPATLNLITDVTERRNAEGERQSLAGRLQRAEKMEALGQMAGGVAHDLNNVLGVLTGYS
jgi:PAS domain S-box-containing protein